METLAAQLTALAAILSALGWLFSKGRRSTLLFRKWLSNFNTQLATIPTLCERMCALEQKVDSCAADTALVKREVMPNGSTSLRDAIERIEERQALEQSSHQNYLSEIGVATWRSDADGAFKAVNREFCRLTGRTPEECLDDRWINSITSAQRTAVVTSWNHAVDDQRDWAFPDVIYEKPDGTRVKARVFAYALTSPAGVFLGHHGFIRKRHGDERD